MRPASHKWTPLPTYIELSKKHEEEKVEKKNQKKKLKKNLSRTLKKKIKKNSKCHISNFSKCHFLNFLSPETKCHKIQVILYRMIYKTYKLFKKKTEKTKFLSRTLKKLVRSESLKWCHKLRRSHSKMEPHNLNSHKMAINTHYIHERTIVLYSHSKEKSKKEKLKKKIPKKIQVPHFIFFLSATFYLMARVCPATKP